MAKIRIALCQTNPTVGAFAANVEAIAQMMKEAENANADLAVFPELAVSGYPPEDLLLRPAFLNAVDRATQDVVKQSNDCAALFGSTDSFGHNIAVMCQKGSELAITQKRALPNYAVFDERRYFVPGRTLSKPVILAGVSVGVVICEDLWVDPSPIDDLVREGAECIAVLNCSPFFSQRIKERLTMVRRRAEKFGVAIVYVNMVGGQDELVFDGGSFAIDADGIIIGHAGQFCESLAVVDLEVTSTPNQVHTRSLSTATRAGEEHAMAECRDSEVALDMHQELYSALVVGTRDYVYKNGFTDVVLGLSGGVDSALVAVIAADALGAEHVHAVAMPSRHTSDASNADAAALANNLGIDLLTAPILEAHQVLQSALTQVAGTFDGLADENLQSRIRGMMLMGLSNQLGWLVLTTGNKSEIAVGYSTLYGDSAGGFAVLKDVVKTRVYSLCEWRNAQAVNAGHVAPLPRSILTKAPTAELRENQRDDQSLPPYPLLDQIIAFYVEQEMSVDEIAEALIERGEDASPEVLDETIHSIVRLINLSEYKRRQSPIGVRVTPRAFGRDYRMPITNRFRE